MSVGTIIGVASLGFFVLVGIAAVYYEQQEVRRQQKLWAEWAKARQWRHAIRDDTVFEGQQAQPFGRGRSQRTDHVFHGRWADLDITLFYYTYLTGGGKTTRTHQHTVAQFPCSASFPELVIRRGKVLNLTDDIQFESARFNEAFDVRSADERFAFAIVHPRFMAALLDDALGSFNLTFEDGVVSVWCDEHLMRSQVLSAVRALVTAVEHVPSHVWREYGAEPPKPTDAGSSPYR